MNNERLLKLTISALLHDIGKIIYRQGEDTRKHSLSGYDYLKDRIGLKDEEVLNGVLYHHADMLKKAALEEDDLAYIVYVADNIASAADRRPSEDFETGFDIHTPLKPVFDHLNKNDGNFYYSPYILNETAGINYPEKDKQRFSKSDYDRIMRDISDHLKGIEWNGSYVQSLLEVLEVNLSYIPSATSKQEVPDISLFDHMKMTAAYSGCIFQYLVEKGISNYKEVLFLNAKDFYHENVFLLASMDISGIQDFIYTITTKNALRMLRARSFYLEIVMEHLIDTLLEMVGLGRANLIYSGGGHCYLLLPNTENTKNIFDAFISEVNQWMLDMFGIALYVAGGYAECSSMSLRNEPEGSYGQIFKDASAMISKQKLHRYRAEDIIKLNRKEHIDYSRECRVCHRLGRLDEEDHCMMCGYMKKLSANVLYADFFMISKEEAEGVPLPFGSRLIAGDKRLVRELQEKDDTLRIYGKNGRFTGKNISTKLWLGSYTTGETFEELADKSQGISRIGVLRADVDNLGRAFVEGFNNPENNNRYVSLSRTATLSRQLSLFFKYYINTILQVPGYRVFSSGNEAPRNAAIVYSGGDDLFVVGAWDDVVEIGLDLKKRFERYTEGTLSLSAGIGLYSPSYPVQVIADEVGRMEEQAKKDPGKSAITCFDGNTYKWDVFETKVLQEKYAIISSFFQASEELGKNFLYNILSLIRKQEERINFARFIYLMSRMEPGQEVKQQQKDSYQEFSKAMIQWIQTAEDRKQMETAIIMYVYHIREKEEKA